MFPLQNDGRSLSSISITGRSLVPDIPNSNYTTIISYDVSKMKNIGALVDLYNHVNQGGGGGLATCDVGGDFVVYCPITDGLRRLHAVLSDVEEVWIVYHRDWAETLEDPDES